MSNEIIIKLDRDTYKKLQNIKMVTDNETIAKTISQMVDIYGEQYKQKVLIHEIHKSRK